MVDLKQRAYAKPDFVAAAKSMASTPETAAVAREHLLYCFRCTLQNLTEHQAAALLLKEVNGLSNREVGLALELEPAQVKNRLQEARSTMRRHYANTCALAEQQGVCHQCMDLDGFFAAHGGDPLGDGDGDLPHRLRVIRDHEGLATGRWTQMLESLLGQL